MASRAAARRLGITDPVTIRASVLRSGSDPESGDPAGYRTARAAYEEPGIGPDELDVVELHDAAAPAELMRYESLQLAPRARAAGWSARR